MLHKDLPWKCLETTFGPKCHDQICMCFEYIPLALLQFQLAQLKMLFLTFKAPIVWDHQTPDSDQQEALFACPHQTKCCEYPPQLRGHFLGWNLESGIFPSAKPAWPQLNGLLNRWQKLPSLGMLCHVHFLACCSIRWNCLPNHVQNTTSLSL